MILLKLLLCMLKRTAVQISGKARDCELTAGNQTGHFNDRMK